MLGGLSFPGQRHEKAINGEALVGLS